VRDWRKFFAEGGVGRLRRFEAGGSVSLLSQAQEETLVEYVSQALPRSTREVGVFIEQVFGVAYDSRSGLIALLHRLGLAYRKPETIGRRMDARDQQAFIAAYEKLLNSLGPDEATLFVDAVHPTYAAQSVGCWAPAGEALAVGRTSGRERLNIHGALDLETGKTAMIEVESVDAASTIRPLQTVESLYPRLARIHVFLDNARYHHAVLVREWLASPAAGSGCASSPPTARI